MDTEIAANAFIEAHLHFLDDFISGGAGGDMFDTVDRAERDANFASCAATIDHSNGERSFLLVGEFIGELLR